MIWHLRSVGLSLLLLSGGSTLGNAHPLQGNIRQATEQSAILRVGCEDCCANPCWHHRWRSHYRWGSQSEHWHNRWRSHFRWGSYGGYGHGREFSHNRWGSYHRLWRPYRSPGPFRAYDGMD